MNSRSEPVSDEWLAMSDEERMAELRRGRQIDPDELSPELARRRDAVLAEMRERHRATNHPPLRVIDCRPGSSQKAG